MSGLTRSTGQCPVTRRQIRHTGSHRATRSGKCIGHEVGLIDNFEQVSVKNTRSVHQPTVQQTGRWFGNALPCVWQILRFVLQSFVRWIPFGERSSKLPSSRSWRFILGTLRWVTAMREGHPSTVELDGGRGPRRRRASLIAAQWERTTYEGVARRRCLYTVKQKRTIVRSATARGNVKAAAREFQIEPCQIRDWRRNLMGPTNQTSSESSDAEAIIQFKPFSTRTSRRRTRSHGRASTLPQDVTDAV